MISSESTRVPPVTAERSPPDSRITGADSPVMADSSTEATPSTTSPSPGINSPAMTITAIAGAQLRAGNFFDAVPSAYECGCAMVSRARFAQRVGLRFAAAFGHGFGEIGEEHGEPEPERDLQLEAEAAGVLRRCRASDRRW